MARKKTKKRKSKVKQNTKLKKTKYSLLCILLLCFSFSCFHLYKHPSLVFYPVSGFFYKSSYETWDKYQNEFYYYGSKKVEPEFLGALAQTESMGNPFALTYWQSGWSLNPLNWYRPASTATGILQITDGTWRDMKKYCLGTGGVQSASKLGACPGNIFRFRIFPSHAIHLVSAWFHKKSEDLNVGKQLRRKYLSVLHLCGFRKAKELKSKSFNLKRIGNCGSHSPSRYFSRVERAYNYMKKLSQKKIRSQIAKR